MKWLISAFFLLQLSNLFSQHLFITEHDLPRQPQINLIAEDSFYFKWLGTDQGLFYYNGYNLLQIDRPDSLIKPVSALAVEGNEIYAGYSDGKIIVADAVSKRSAFLETPEITDKISSLHIEEDLKVIFTYGSGIFISNGNEMFHLNASSGLSSNDIYSGDISSEGVIYAATDNGINYFSLQDRSVHFISNLMGEIVTDVICTSDSVYAGTYTGKIYRFHIHDNTADMILSGLNGPVRHLSNGTDFLLYTAGDNLWYQRNRQRIKVEDREKGISTFTTFLLDHNFQLWMAGPNYLATAPISFWWYDNQPEAHVQAVLVDDAMIYYGTDKGLYTAMPDLKAKLVQPGSYSITTLLKEGNHILAGTFNNGLLVYEQDVSGELRLQRHLLKRDGLLDNSILALATKESGKVALSTLAGLQYLSTSDFKISSPKTPVDESYILELYYAPDNRLFIGCDRTGFQVLGSDEMKSYKFYSETAQPGSVFSITSTGDLHWISSQNEGLMLLRGDSLFRSNIEKTYTSLIPLNNQRVLGISVKSIDLLKYSGNNISSFSYHLFDEEKEAEPYINNYSVSGQKVFFIHHNLLIEFTPPPDHLISLPGLIIDHIEVNLDRVTGEGKVFPQSDNNFRFHYTGSWIHDPDRLEYRYKLLGFDKDWRYTQDRSVAYPHLPPGEYKFVVQTANNQDFSEYSEAAYSFEIERAFYNSFWFYLLIFLILTGIILLILRKIRKDKKLREDLEKKKVETQLINLKSQLSPHFMFNSFNTLLALIESDREKSISYTEKLTDFYRLLLEYGDKELVKLNEELRIVRIYFDLLKERFGEALVLNIDVPDTDYNIPPLTIQMLLENAVKHNYAKKNEPLVIQIIQEEHILKVTNHKNLRNINGASLGIGIKNIKERMKLHGYPQPEIINGKSEFKVILKLKTS